MKINNTCSFTSKIVITNSDNFYKLMNDKKTKYSEQNIVKGKNVCAAGVSTCIGGGATNKEEAMAFHFCRPERKELEDIYESIKALEIKGKKPNIFITGGLSPWDMSRIYFDNVIEKLEEFKKSTTIIWGQKKGDFTNAYYDAIKDIWTVYHSGQKINSLKDLQDIYEIIRLADSDELWIAGKKISSKLL